MEGLRVSVPPATQPSARMPDPGGSLVLGLRSQRARGTPPPTAVFLVKKDGGDVGEIRLSGASCAPGSHVSDSQ